MKNLNRFASLLLAATMGVGCVSATVTEPSVCDTVDLGTLPTSPVSDVWLPPTSFTTPSENYSSVVSKVQDVASNISVDISHLTIDNDGSLNWVYSVTVLINGAPGSTTLATYQAAYGQPVGNTLVLNVVLDQGELLSYLSSPFTLTFQVAGYTPTKPVNLTNTLCVGLSGQFNKSL